MRFVTLALFASSVLAFPAKQDILPTIVFTPGAWHGTWAFDTVRSQLETLGYPTEAVALPSVGSNNLTVGLTEDASALRAELTTLTNAGKDVIMVVHSYGGVVGTNAVEGLGYAERAAAGLSGGVIMLIYMTAFAVPKGTSLLDGLGGSYLPWMTLGDDGFVTPATPETIFYADVTDAALVAKAVAGLEPEPARIFSDKTTYEPWNQGVEVGFFFMELDQAIPIATQKAMASQFPADSFTYTMNSSHSPFLSMPQKLAAGVVAASKDALLKKVL
ncbi:hypothetical protein ONS95_002473 [Cadophora gregata]|uniref:uncharacterized protein n=1 Tax=Cadophora gregata TaxID=51156 RepID=UPI0026DC4959|nr:uncharacterized protein ONS95_002473 [Cadophora gregata]KAK0109800.1 hypothetical protein ONS95_002473 [Cadophora gregata]KAK0110572.1 hypothetical protein ONS96_002177 [Cadophora gregata f. sp. sojae]